MNEHFFNFLDIINSLSIYENIKNDPLIKLFEELLSIFCFEEVSYKNFLKIKKIYSKICSLIWQHPSHNLSEYVYELILYDENLISKKQMGAEILSAAVVEFENLLRIALELKSELITNYIYAQYRAILPEINNLPHYMTYDAFERGTNYEDIIRFYNEKGYGIFAKYDAFLFDGNELKPVVNKDCISLDMLKLYNREKDLVFNNTEAFIYGRSYHNVLLYGDRGCGKSSVVKAVANKFSQKGLRIVQIRKDNLCNLDVLIDKLSDSPLKFIVFIDDLTFNEDDDGFNALKASLEGSLQRQPENIAIYATSNRCHLVKESFTAREGDEIHLSDTLNEICSLSDRFGLIINYIRPPKDDYLQIVKLMAIDKNLEMDDQTLFDGAEVFALEKGGRSPRIATQYITELCS